MKSINTIISLILGMVCIFLVIVTHKNGVNNSPRHVFESNKKSIVEVKAYDDLESISYGTGVLYEKGKIITNAHIISSKNISGEKIYSNIYIRFVDEEDYQKVNVLKCDYDLDLAIIETNFDNTRKTINFSERNYKTGDEIYAIGNSSNYGISISKGIISLREIDIEYNNKIKSVIQLNINIQNGNSGGALLDRKGDLIGLTTFRTKDMYGNINYGYAYAIPLKTIIEFTRGVS